MNTRDIKRIAQLWRLREVRARHALEKQRLALSDAQIALEKQQQLIEELQRKVEQATLSDGNSTLMSAATVQERSLYRRTLKLDMGRERYGRSIAVDDVREERKKLNNCRSAWARENVRLESVPAMQAKEQGRTARKQLRKESNQMDDLFDQSPSALGKEHV